jgi:hypothetical protein
LRTKGDTIIEVQHQMNCNRILTLKTHKLDMYFQMSAYPTLIGHLDKLAWGIEQKFMSPIHSRPMVEVFLGIAFQGTRASSNTRVERRVGEYRDRRLLCIE